MLERVHQSRAARLHHCGALRSLMTHVAPSFKLLPQEASAFRLAVQQAVDPLSANSSSTTGAHASRSSKLKAQDRLMAAFTSVRRSKIIGKP